MPEIIDGVDGAIVMTIVSIAVICLQFFCCWKWNHILVRLLPIITTAICALVFFILMSRVPADAQQLYEEYTAGLIISGTLLGASVAGWIAWNVYCFAHGRTRRNPAGY